MDLVINQLAPYQEDSKQLLQQILLEVLVWDSIVVKDLGHLDQLLFLLIEEVSIVDKGQILNQMIQ